MSFNATYLLLALTLAVGLPLVQANAVKNAVVVPVTIMAMLVFAFKGSIDWTLGAVMGAGSIAGGVLGARLATSLQARKCERRVFGRCQVTLKSTV